MGIKRDKWGVRTILKNGEIMRQKDAEMEDLGKKDGSDS